jgi:hypothetical protein
LYVSAFVFHNAPPTALQPNQHAGDVERETETSPVDKSHNNAVRPRGCRVDKGMIEACFSISKQHQTNDALINENVMTLFQLCFRLVGEEAPVRQW